MAITRQTKEEQVAGLVEQLQRSKMVVLTGYKGLSVADMQNLRAQLQESGANLRVIKNNLTKLALASVENLKNVDTTSLDGPVALAFSFDDEVAAPQVLAKFGKTNEAVEILGGFSADGDVLSADQVKHLATLPSKEQLLGQFVSVLAGPSRDFVTVLGGNLRGIVQVFNQIKEQKALS